MKYLRPIPESINTVNIPRYYPLSRFVEVNTLLHRSVNHNLVSIKKKSSSIVVGEKNLKVCNFNPRSVKNKTIALSDFILSSDFYVVALTETWLGSAVDKT